jgi:hypothetical protein
LPRQSRKPRRGDGDGHATVETTPTLEQRVVHLEEVLIEVRRTLDVQFQRIAAMQAQLDHLSARKIP